MKTSTTQRCSNCRFWMPPPNPKPTESGGVIGLCRRFPPTPVWTGIRVNSATATSFDTDWCGEWQAYAG